MDSLFSLDHKGIDGRPLHSFVQNILTGGGGG